MSEPRVAIPAAEANEKEMDHDKTEQSSVRDTAEVVSPAVLSEIRRLYRIMKRHGFLRDAHVRYWWTRNVSRLTKENANLQPTGGIRHYAWLLNKCTFYYFTQHETDSFEEQAWLHNDAMLVAPKTTSVCSSLGAAVCKSWYEVHDEEPNIDWGRYFAYPFLVVKRSPTLVELVDMHRTICQQSVKRQQDAAETWRLETPGHWEGNDPRNYRSFPLCWALMVVQDNYIDPLTHPELEPLDLDDPEYLNIYRQIQTVVLVRTGDEKFISTPIDFSTIVDKSLPLNRPDLPPDSGIDAIRVSLHDAVKFIAEIQKHEEKEYPHVYHIKRRQNHTHTDLLPRNPTGEERDGRYYPASEDEYMSEVLKVDKYICSRRIIDEAKEAVLRRGTGPKNDLLWAVNRYGSVPLWLDKS